MVRGLVLKNGPLSKENRLAKSIEMPNTLFDNLPEIDYDSSIHSSQFLSALDESQSFES
jgi:hypothetical protein